MSARALTRTVPDPPRRRDAARSRAAILAAARELFATGRDVPMYEIARHAGVGQATLYRHYADRAAIVAAISREHVERIEATAAECDGDPGAVTVVLAAATAMFVAIHDVLGMLREDAALAPVIDELRGRMRAVFERALCAAPRGDALRDDITAEDLMLVLRMINGALAGISTAADRAAAAARALELAMLGLRER